LGNPYLVLVCGPHVFDNLLSLGFWNATVLSQDAADGGIDLTSHVSGITADIDVSLLLQKIVDLFAALLEPVLDVDLLGAVS
jgi:hypothetical protein